MSVYTLWGVAKTRAKLFRNGQSQAVRLPKAFAFTGQEVFVRRVGDAVLLVPCADPWTGFEAALGQFSDDFMRERVQPADDVRESF
ncbi:MAG: antitoxin [Myxococcales bacterium]|nr:antitoxin [Myxococcales bacterium]